MLFTGQATKNIRRAHATQLAALGATVQARHGGHVVLTDPEGNEFCLSGAQP